MNTSRVSIGFVVVALTMVASSAFAGLVTPPTVPEPASTAALLGISLASLALGRQMLRK